MFPFPFPNGYSSVRTLLRPGASVSDGEEDDVPTARIVQPLGTSRVFTSPGGAPPSRVLVGQGAPNKGGAGPTPRLQAAAASTLAAVTGRGPRAAAAGGAGGAGAVQVRVGPNAGLNVLSDFGTNIPFYASCSCRTRTPYGTFITVIKTFITVIKTFTSVIKHFSFYLIYE